MKKSHILEINSNKNKTTQKKEMSQNRREFSHFRQMFTKMKFR